MLDSPCEKNHTWAVIMHILLILSVYDIIKRTTNKCK